MRAWIAIMSALAVLGTGIGPALAVKLSRKEEQRIARAAPDDRYEYRRCLEERKRRGNKGAVAGTAAGAGGTLLAGGNLGEAALVAGVGAVAGNAIGKSTRKCDKLLRTYGY